MKKIAVILYGQPGAGKGTQANLLAAKFGLIHLDTGKFLESIVHDPARQKEAVVRRERKLFDTGILMTPSFVTREVVRGAKRIAGSGWGIVFSGSPRTIYEAEREYPILEKLYGKKNILVFALDLPAEYYLFPAELYAKKSARPKRCPVCAGPFYKRSLDKPEVIKVRLEEYRKRTFPIFDFLKKRGGYRVIHVDARPAPYKVAERIYACIKNA